MKPVKRVEMVVDALEVPHLLERLSHIDINAYTVIRDAHGKGERGTRGGDVFSGTFDNSYIVIACTEEQSRQLVETVRPILKRLGGICLVSDAMWVLH
jgi:nitrogen regulatory protein PII